MAVHKPATQNDEIQDMQKKATSRTGEGKAQNERWQDAFAQSKEDVQIGRIHQDSKEDQLMTQKAQEMDQRREAQQQKREEDDDSKKQFEILTQSRNQVRYSLDDDNIFTQSSQKESQMDVKDFHPSPNRTNHNGQKPRAFKVLHTPNHQSPERYTLIDLTDQGRVIVKKHLDQPNPLAENDYAIQSQDQRTSQFERQSQDNL